MDAIRYITDENFRQQLDLGRLTHNKRFGQAIILVRQKHRLTKADIANVSERQLRRIENEGARPSLKTLALLAQ